MTNPSRCPHCGAPVQVEPDQQFYQCASCRATTWVSSPQPGGPSGASAPGLPVPPGLPPPQLQQPSGSSNATGLVIGLSIGAVVLFGALILVGAGVAAALFTVRAAPPPIPAPTTPPLYTAAPAPTPIIQFVDRPLLFDVNGDGVDDLLGACRRFTPAQEQWIGAFNGADGSALWELPIGKEASEGESRRAIVGDKLVVIDTLGKVFAYDAHKGSLVWTQSLGERPREVCAGADFVGITSADKQHKIFALSDGAVRAPAAPGGCKPTWVSRSSDGVGYEIIDWPEFRQYGVPDLHAVEGISAYRALVPEQGSVRFMLGSKSPGTSVAMVAAVHGAKVVWKELVPGVDPLTTTVNVSTQVACVADGKLVVPYGISDPRSVRVACLDGSTGKRLWDVAVPGVRGDVSNGLSIADGNVFYSTWTSVHVLALSSGEQQWTIGSD